MRIIAFVTDTKELRSIMKSQGVAQARAPPPIPKPPSEKTELVPGTFLNFKQFKLILNNF